MLMKLYTVAVYDLLMYMKGDNPCQTYFKGDNSKEITSSAGQGSSSFVLTCCSSV